jgi:Proteins of 100 residues with WXG
MKGVSNYMSDKKSFPINQLRQVAQQIINDSDNLMNETGSRLQQMRNTNGGLPGSMQGSFSNLFDPLQRNLGQVLALHQGIGQTLMQAADVAEGTEMAIDAPLVGQ